MWVNQGDYKWVGKVLVDARESVGLTQQVLAARLGKPQSFVSNYERGQRRLDILELVKIVDALGLKPRRVFSEIVRRVRGSASSRRRKH